MQVDVIEVETNLAAAGKLKTETESAEKKKIKKEASTSGVVQDSQEQKMDEKEEMQMNKFGPLL